MKWTTITLSFTPLPYTHEKFDTNRVVVGLYQNWITTQNGEGGEVLCGAILENQPLRVWCYVWNVWNDRRTHIHFSQGVDFGWDPSRRTRLQGA